MHKQLWGMQGQRAEEKIWRNGAAWAAAALWQGTQDRGMHSRPLWWMRWVGYPTHQWEGEGVRKCSFYRDERGDEGIKKTRLPNVSKYLGQKETEIQDRSSEDLSRPTTLILPRGWNSVALGWFLLQGKTKWAQWCNLRSKQADAPSTLSDVVFVPMFRLNMKH